MCCYLISFFVPADSLYPHHIYLSTYELLKVCVGARGCQDTAHQFPLCSCCYYGNRRLISCYLRISNWPFPTFAPDVLVQFVYLLSLLLLLLIDSANADVDSQRAVIFLLAYCFAFPLTVTWNGKECVDYAPMHLWRSLYM